MYLGRRLQEREWNGIPKEKINSLVLVSINAVHESGRHYF
jgi:hypothetical protein